MVESKAFLQIQRIDIAYPNEKNMIEKSIAKRIENIMSIQVCLIPQMGIDYKENGGKKNISCKSKASILRIPMRRT